MRFTAPASARQIDLGLALLRVVTGVVFIAHGARQVFGGGVDGIASALGGPSVPLAGVVAPLVVFLELSGGLALIVGVLTRPIALALSGETLGALLLLHPPVGFSLPDGYEFVFALLGAAAALAVLGAGGWSLDARIEARRIEEA